MSQESSNTGNRPNPYVGPRPFKVGESALFFGRSREAAEVSSLIIAHPLLLLYAQSGAGKTSLINAGIIPLLEKKGAQVLDAARVSGALPQDVSSKDIANIFTFNAVFSIAQDGDRESATLGKTTISDYLKTLPYPSARAGKIVPRVLIFDQFEELFTHYADRWADRKGFFDDLASAMEDEARPLRVVIAMREEFIGGMQPYASRLPEWLRIRFRLERLGEQEALQAIHGPLKGLNRSFAPKAAEKLVANLRRATTQDGVEMTEEFVEPVHLQLVCSSIWRDWPRNAAEIQERQIKEYGDVDKALSDYYDHCIAEVAKKRSVKEGEIRRWFDSTLITPAGTRAIVFQGGARTAGLENNLVEDLEKLYLVRPEKRGPATWYELSHDRFIGPVRTANQQWRSARDRGKVTWRILETKAERWKQDAGELMAGGELAEALRWIQSPAGREIGTSGDLTQYINASKDAEEIAHQKTRFKKKLMTYGVAGAYVVIMLAGYVASEVEKTKKVARAMLEERARVSDTLLRQGGADFEALAYAIKAVAPAVEELELPSDAGLSVLKRSIDALGSDRFLLPLSNRQDVSEFSPDGKLLLTRRANAVEIWEVDQGKRLSTFEIPTDADRSGLAITKFSPDGRLVLVTTRGQFMLGNARTGAILLKPEPVEDLGTQSRAREVQAIFSPSGALLIARQGRGRDRLASTIWRLEGDGVRELGRTPAGGRVKLFDDEKRFIMINDLGGAELFGIADPSVPRGKVPPVATIADVWDAVVFPDNQGVAIFALGAPNDEKAPNLRIWHWSPPRQWSRKTGISIDQVTFSPNGAVVRVTGDGRMHDFEASSGKSVGVPSEAVIYRDAKGKPDGPSAVPQKAPPIVGREWRLARENGQYSATHTKTGQKVLFPLPDKVARVAISPDATLVAYTDSQGRARLHKIGAGVAVSSSELGPDSLLRIGCDRLRPHAVYEEAKEACARWK